MYNVYSKLVLFLLLQLRRLSFLLFGLGLCGKRQCPDDEGAAVV